MKWFVSFFVLLILNFDAVAADVFAGDKYLSSDLVVHNGERYMPDSVHITDDIKIENNGLFQTEVFVDDGVRLYLENHAVINSSFNLGSDARIIQVINDNADMVGVKFNVGYDVLVDGADGLALSNVLEFATDADVLHLRDSVLDINDIAGTISRNIEIGGDVVLRANDFSRFYDVPFLENASGVGTVRLYGGAGDPLFADVVRFEDNKLYFGRVRETDYVKIFNDGCGAFLNDLRINNPNDSLLGAMDRADNMDALRHIMMRSVRFNPGVLQDVIGVVNSVNMMGYIFDTAAGANVIIADDFNSYGAKFSVHENLTDNISGAVSLRIGNIEYENWLDKFDGNYFGGDISFGWDLSDKIWLRAIGGLTYGIFDTGRVFYDNKVMNSPDVLAGFLYADFGYDFDLFDMLKLRLWGGVENNFYVVSGVDYYDSALHGGMSVGWSVDMMGIRYDYSAGMDTNTDSKIGVFGRIGFWSDMDAIGGDATAGVMHVFDMLAYKVALNMRWMF